MSTLTEIVAVVVMHSSTAALSHFGVAVTPAQVEHTPPVAQRVVARTHRKVEKVSAKDCPQAVPLSRA
jgi:hypothetical protein